MTSYCSVAIFTSMDESVIRSDGNSVSHVSSSSHKLPNTRHSMPAVDTTCINHKIQRGDRSADVVASQQVHGRQIVAKRTWSMVPNFLVDSAWRCRILQTPATCDSTTSTTTAGGAYSETDL